MSVNLAEILSAIPLFSALDQSQINGLVKLMSLKSFTANQSILEEGHSPPGLYIILSGKVAVEKIRGSDADHICDLDGGECVGEVEIIDDLPCIASVVCHGDVETAVIERSSFEGYLEANPSAANKILRKMVGILAARLRQTNVYYSSLMAVTESID